MKTEPNDPFGTILGEHNAITLDKAVDAWLKLPVLQRLSACRLAEKSVAPKRKDGEYAFSALGMSFGEHRMALRIQEAWAELVLVSHTVALRKLVGATKDQFALLYGDDFPEMEDKLDIFMFKLDAAELDAPENGKHERALREKLAEKVLNLFNDRAMVYLQRRMTASGRNPAEEIIVLIQE